jgi:hypothetical protein
MILQASVCGTAKTAPAIKMKKSFCALSCFSELLPIEESDGGYAPTLERKKLQWTKIKHHRERTQAFSLLTTDSLLGCAYCSPRCCWPSA